VKRKDDMVGLNGATESTVISNLLHGIERLDS